MDLQDTIDSLIKDLDIAVKQLRKSGDDYGKAYRDYRIAVAQELLILKNEGYAITLAGDIARGKPHIAELKYKEIAKEAIYKANLEAINTIKLKLKIVAEQFNREWSNEQ